jgi:hypothetical protein
LILGVPLTPWGTLWFFIFNTLCVLSLIAHWRAAWADPGSIPKMKEAPGSMDPSRVKFCKKCDFNWKPERAHHCSECGTCVFKVFFPLYLYNRRWIIIAPGLTIALVLLT